jgi:sugar lactone lactonase YvrE
VQGSIILKTAGFAMLAVAAIAAYLCLWPVPADPVAWQAPMPPGYIGPHAANTKLADLRMIDHGGEVGPEHIAIGPDGKVYAAVESGKLLSMDADGGKQATFANTGGRVLGFDFDAKGRLIAADAYKGLLAVTPDGAVNLLTDHVTPDDPIRYADAVIVAPDGTIYFTDASTRFSPSDWGGSLGASLLDMMEHSATGRVLAYDPETGKTRIVASSPVHLPRPAKFVSLPSQRL